MKNVIYKIRNVINNKFYVGSSVDSRKRFWEHRKNLRNGTHHSVALQRAWVKYGEDCFKFEVIERYDTKEELHPAEQRWLDAHYGEDYCYNTSHCADTPMRNASLDFRAKHAQTMRDYYSGNPHPREGLRHTEESKSQMSETRKGKAAGEDHYRYGKTVSEEVRRKIGDTQRGVKKAPGRKVSAEGLAKIQESIKAGRWSKGLPPKELAAVVVKFPEEVRDKYDFSNAIYTGALVRIEGCVCPIHGEFSQYAAQFRKGRGCPQCGAEQRAQSKKQQMLSAWRNPEERTKMMEARKK